MAAAAKAFFDWMPIRRPERNGYRIYRSIDWGNLARIVLLDARYIGRDRQVFLSRDLGAPTPELVETLRRQLFDPGRSMLGAPQEAWLAETLADSKRRGQPWQVIVQQTMVGDHFAPRGLSRLLSDATPPNIRFRYLHAEEWAGMGMPLKPDQWAGYPVARARFLQSCATNAANALVVSGDSHNCWFNNLRVEGKLAALEFAGGAVSSAGQDELLTNVTPGQREAVFQSGNPDLVACDATHRGYSAITLTPEACAADWIWFDDVLTRTRSAPNVMRLRTEPTSTAGMRPWTLDG
jgi:alkaline phosphatase D